MNRKVAALNSLTKCVIQMQQTKAILHWATEDHDYRIDEQIAETIRSMKPVHLELIEELYR